MEYYDALFGWMEEEENEAKAQEERRRQKEAEEAFDNMMGNPEKTVTDLFNKVMGGKFL